MLVQREYVLVIILFLYAVYGLMETGWYMITHNIFLITFSTLLYRKSVQNRKQGEKCVRVVKGSPQKEYIER